MDKGDAAPARAGAGSLVHEAKPSRREEFVRYMRKYYDGASSTEGWTVLGYDSAEDLEKEFHAFLERLAQ